MDTLKVYIDLFLNWQAVLDIGLIAAAMFVLYRTFIRLGSWQIMVGVLAAFGIFVLANLLNLQGIEWIYRNVSHVALLALIIIFQPEIRKIAEKVVSLALNAKQRPSAGTAAIVAESLWELAEQNRGAIVVLPGREEISEKASGGYLLNALPSRPLIMSIFDPNSPGHDGALILRRDLLSRFGTRLPMSATSRLSSEYGTRHHAAMGMSEQTDSLVLLVSEERGRVAAFRNGEMSIMGSTQDIVQAIDRHFLQSGFLGLARKGGVAPRTLIQLACSVLAALAFWSTLILGEQQVVERTLTIPIEYTPPPEGLILMGNRVNELVIHAAGPKSAISEFILSGPKARVDLSAQGEGRQSVLFSSENVLVPRDVKILDIAPPATELVLAAIVEQRVPVVPQLIGRLPAGLKIKKLDVYPDEISVLAPPPEGEKQRMNLSTTPIYLNSISRDGTVLCKIIAPPSFQPVDRRWPDVEVRIELQ